MKRPLAVAIAGAAFAGVVPSAAPAATITVGTPCARYVPGLAGQQWIPIAGTGFTPNTNPAFNSVELNYDNGDLGAFTPLAVDGSFGTNVFMPSEFISSSSGRTKTYTLIATDRQTPGVTAAAPVTLVRAGADVKPARVRRNLRRTVRWSVYGAPTGTRVYAHWTFKGRRYASRGLGTAKGACGIVSKKQPFLPVSARSGTWKVYFTPGKKFVRRQALFRLDLSVFRSLSSRASAARLR